MSKRVIAAISFQSMISTFWPIYELSRYILAWQKLAPTAPQFITTQLELVGMWALWLMWQVFLVMILTQVRLRCDSGRARK